MIPGAFRMPTWSAGSWSVDMQYQPWETPILALALAPSPWTMCSAQGWSLTSGSARAEAGSPTIVPTVKMLESFAQVSYDVIRGRLVSPPTCCKVEAEGWWPLVSVAQFWGWGSARTSQLVPSRGPCRGCSIWWPHLCWLPGPQGHYTHHRTGIQCVFLFSHLLCDL